MLKMRAYLINFILPLPIAVLTPLVVKVPWWTSSDYVAVYVLGVFTMFLYDLRSWVIRRAVTKGKERKSLSHSGGQD